MRIDSFNKRFLAIIAMALAVVVVLGIVSGIMSAGFVKSTGEVVVVVQATVDGDNLHIFGYSEASGWKLAGQEVTVVGRTLYLRLRFALQIKRDTRYNGNFACDVNMGFSNIDQIYLQGNNKEDTKLIWQR